MCSLKMWKINMKITKVSKYYFIFYKLHLYSIINKKSNFTESFIIEIKKNSDEKRHRPQWAIKTRNNSKAKST